MVSILKTIRPNLVQSNPVEFSATVPLCQEHGASSLAIAWHRRAHFYDHSMTTYIIDHMCFMWSSFWCAFFILLMTWLPLWPCYRVTFVLCLLSASTTDLGLDCWPFFCLVTLYFAAQLLLTSACSWLWLHPGVLPFSCHLPGVKA